MFIANILSAYCKVCYKKTSKQIILCIEFCFKWVCAYFWQKKLIWIRDFLLCLTNNAPRQIITISENVIAQKPIKLRYVCCECTAIYATSFKLRCLLPNKPFRPKIIFSGSVFLYTPAPKVSSSAPLAFVSVAFHHTYVLQD